MNVQIKNEMAGLDSTPLPFHSTILALSFNNP